jgi:glutamate synthase domain-containing protein 3
MASLGIRKIEDMIGRTELLEVNSDILPWKAKDIDFSKILYKPQVDASVGTHKTMEQHHPIDDVLDLELIKRAQPAIKEDANVKIELPIRNDNRSVGTMLSGEICKTYGEDGLTEGTIQCKFTGFAGQSFGAFLAKGVTFELEGMANDYIGKGISGGKIIVYPNKKTDYVPKDNIIIGNTTFYGAIAGEAYIRGVAGERFCIRNSGLLGVVEGVGDHGCEYMTGGTVVILGRTGRNFAAGMSGGVAYVYDKDGTFKSRCNMSMVDLEKLEEEDLSRLQSLLSNHYQYTDSSSAKAVLDDFKNASKKFVKIMPIEYKRIMEQKKVEEKLKLTEVGDG